MKHLPSSIPGEIVRTEAATTIDLLDILWRRRWYVVSCTLLAIILGFVFCSLATPMYESTADVLVVQKRPQAVTGEHQYASGFEDYLATHLAIVASPVIIERAIKASDLASLESFADLEEPEEDLVDEIIDNLEVESGSRDLGENADSIMTLAYRSSVPEDAPVVVQAILDSYKSFHHEVYRGMSGSTVELIGEARDLLKHDLANQEETYSQFRQESPLVSNGNDEVNPLQSRLAAIELRRSELLLRRAEVEAQLTALEGAKKTGADREELLARVTEMRQQSTAEGGLPTVSTVLENQLIQLIDDEQGLLEHYGPNHPHVLTMRQRISDARRLFALPTSAHFPEKGSGETSSSDASDRDPVAVYTDYLEQELKSLQIAEDFLADVYDREHDLAKEYSIYQLKDTSFRRGIERTEALYDVVINRLQEASLVKDYGGFETTVIAPPRLGEKVSPSRRILLPVAAIAGLFLGSLLALAVEFLDDSFYSCDQVQQQLGLPIVGRIPQISSAPSYARIGDGRGKESFIDPALCVHHSPRTSAAEAYRGLRTAIYFNGHGESSRVLQVTGLDAGDGASTVVANLAISLAQTGKRVLLIDTDLREQRQCKLFGIPSQRSGLATIITSDVEPMDAIRQTSVDNLSLLPAGSLPEGPCELFTSSRFGELLDLFRDSYDQVLIDTEPLLSATDPFVIASQTDGVILTLRLGRDSRARAIQAKQMMERVDVEIVGVVVNRADGVVLGQHFRESAPSAASFNGSMASLSKSGNEPQAG